jgi:hypothetical protein
MLRPGLRKKGFNFERGAKKHTDSKGAPSEDVDRLYQSGFRL